MSGLFDVGSKALNVARFWPAGLASLVVGTAPTTGAVVGVVAISIFIIIIWLVIYSKCYITHNNNNSQRKREWKSQRWRLILSIFVNFHFTIYTIRHWSVARRCGAVGPARLWHEFTLLSRGSWSSWNDATPAAIPRTLSVQPTFPAESGRCQPDRYGCYR